SGSSGRVFSSTWRSTLNCADKMAAAPVRTLCCSVLRLSSRQFSTTCGVQAGEKWRKEHGLSRSGTEYGPLTDLPDWSYADGRPAPPMKGQLRRKQEREVLAVNFFHKLFDPLKPERIGLISFEMMGGKRLEMFH
ncbi:39S ribosomal protein L52, mitochondrial, partial [Plectropomus leopardus]|uniref:39S ribosomal protein L52, mitochondrial n=1 Tax=Plectropomus leopardus TaxID=160734 RepID=UPI001C4D580D